MDDKVNARPPYRYHLSYNMKAHPDGITKEELQAQKLSGCDAIFMASILFPPDGSYSCLFIGHDGRTDTELPDIEWFKVFLMLSKRLGDSRTLDEGRRELAKMPFDMFRELMGLGPPPGTPPASGVRLPE